MKTLEQIEREEQVKCDAYVDAQMRGIVPADRIQLHEGALKHFFAVAYWRMRCVGLLLEKEPIAQDLPSAQEQDEWRNG